MQGIGVNPFFKKNRRYSTNLLFSESKALSISKLYCKQLLLLGYKNPSLLRPQNSHNHQTRQSHNYQALRVRTTASQKQPSYQAVRLFNALPVTHRVFVNKKAFSRKASEWLRELDEEEAERLLLPNYV